MDWTRKQTRRIFNKQVGSIRSNRSAFLTEGGVHIAEGTLVIAGVALVVNIVFVEPIRTGQQAGTICAEPEGLCRAHSRVAHLTEGGVLGADLALLVAGIARVVSRVLVEAVRTD